MGFFLLLAVLLLRLVLEEFFGPGLPRLGFPLVLVTRSEEKGSAGGQDGKVFHRGFCLRDGNGNENSKIRL